MKKHSTVIIVIGLFALSAVIYLIQFIQFHDIRDTAFYMLQDWAFLPVQVALVTIVAGKIVNDKEKENRLEKTRMLASSFFSDFGFGLMQKMLPLLTQKEEIIPALSITDAWTQKEFQRASEQITAARMPVKCTPEDLEELKNMLQSKRMSMLVITSNPALLEHEHLTDMLWAIFHLMDETQIRGDFTRLSETDLEHLNVDIQRALRELLINWLCHMNHIRTEYPYLYNLEIKQGLGI